MGVHVFGFVQAARTPGDVVVLKWLTVERLSLLSRARQFPKWLVPLSANEEHSIGGARPQKNPRSGKDLGRALPIEFVELSRTESYGY